MDEGAINSLRHVGQGPQSFPLNGFEVRKVSTFLIFAQVVTNLDIEVITVHAPTFHVGARAGVSFEARVAFTMRGERTGRRLPRGFWCFRRAQTSSALPTPASRAIRRSTACQRELIHRDGPALVAGPTKMLLLPDRKSGRHRCSGSERCRSGLRSCLQAQPGGATGGACRRHLSKARLRG
jgi:hypothetical protein